MAITGLILTLRAPNQTCEVCHKLLHRGGYELGETLGTFLPVTLATADAAEAVRAELDWLNQQPEIAFTDLTYIGYENLTPSAPADKSPHFNQFKGE
jgi:hypothetical protein